MRSGIVSPIKSNIVRPVGSGNLPWSYSVLTPGTDAGKILWAANAAYAVNTAGALSLWCKIPTGSVKVFVELYSSVNDRTSLYYSANNLTVACVRGGGSLLNNVVGFTNDGNWHHYVMTWNGTSYEVYVDGIQKFTSAANYVLTLTTPQIVVSGALSTAAFPCGGNFLGMNVFNAKLSASEVLGLYTANQIPSSCVARFDMQRGVGTTIIPTFGPNANSGTLGTGDTWSATVPTGKTRLASSGIFIGE